MTPKEKAKELVDKFGKIRNYTSYATPLCKSTIKQCALIAVDEIIDTIEVPYCDYKALSKINYWQEVKTEIETL